MEPMPEKLTSFLEEVRNQFAGVDVEMDAPNVGGRIWWVDLYHSGHHVVIEYRPTMGFGISRGGQAAYGEGPERIVTENEQALEVLREFLN